MIHELLRRQHKASQELSAAVVKMPKPTRRRRSSQADSWAHESRSVPSAYRRTSSRISGAHQPLDCTSQERAPISGQLRRHKPSRAQPPLPPSTWSDLHAAAPSQQRPRAPPGTAHAEPGRAWPTRRATQDAGRDGLGAAGRHDHHARPGRDRQRELAVGGAPRGQPAAAAAQHQAAPGAGLCSVLQAAAEGY